jgi:hypothetical protein
MVVYLENLLSLEKLRIQHDAVPNLADSSPPKLSKNSLIFNVDMINVT